MRVKLKGVLWKVDRTPERPPARGTRQGMAHQPAACSELGTPRPEEREGGGGEERKQSKKKVSYEIVVIE